MIKTGPVFEGLSPSTNGDRLGHESTPTLPHLRPQNDRTVAAEGHGTQLPFHFRMPEGA